MQRMGTDVDRNTALLRLGCFSRGTKFKLQSTRFREPALAWSKAVKREVEREGTPCYSPNEDNANVAVIEGEDQQDRDGRWLLVFTWVAKAAAASGGSLLQLVIPGLGLSPMQRAEEMIAQDNDLPIERRVLDEAEARKMGLGDVDGSLLVERTGASEPVLRCIESMRRGSEEEKTAAANELAKRAVNEDTQAAVREAGGIPPLVSLAKEGTAAQKEAAALALANVAKDAQNKIAIREAGGIPPLVSLTKAGTGAQKEQAALALWNLAASDQNKIAIREAGR